MQQIRPVFRQTNVFLIWREWLKLPKPNWFQEKLNKKPPCSPLLWVNTGRIHQSFPQSKSDIFCPTFDNSEESDCLLQYGFWIMYKKKVYYCRKVKKTKHKNKQLFSQTSFNVVIAGSLITSNNFPHRNWMPESLLVNMSKPLYLYSTSKQTQRPPKDCTLKLTY